MKGLLLNSYYLTYKSMYGYLLLSILVSTIVILFADDKGERFALMVILLLASLPSLEMIKKEKISNYDKYLLTLPIKRECIVMNHYIYYILTILLGLIISFAYWVVYTILFGDQTVLSYFSSIGSIIFIVFIAGAITFPSLYLMGHTKSDVIIISSGMIGLLLNVFLQGVLGAVIPENNSFGISADMLSSLIFTIISVFIYLISFFISNTFY
ncbi:ABC-2 transporter permease, partial [Staphylococcus simulans]|uniref:ABC-2 transporter permease n=1 Tax=Staphylococcus simulans TaxID=1286 RepID=UPI000D1DDD17